MARGEEKANGFREGACFACKATRLRRFTGGSAPSPPEATAKRAEMALESMQVFAVPFTEATGKKRLCWAPGDDIERVA